MKKIITSFSIGILLITLFSPFLVSASTIDQEKFINEKLHHEEETIMIGKDEIITEITNDQFIKYRITENEETFDLIFNFVTNEVVVDNLVFDMDIYVDAVNESDGTIKERIINVEPKMINNSYESGLNNDSQISLMATLPTTGYGPLINFGTYKKVNMKVGLATALLTLIDAFLFGGKVTLTRAFVTETLNTAVRKGIIATISGTITSNIYYIKSQATHKTVVGAVKETRRPYTNVQSTRVYGPTGTSYFWSVRPY